jgi:hypothetical protein
MCRSPTGTLSPIGPGAHDRPASLHGRSNISRVLLATAVLLYCGLAVLRSCCTAVLLYCGLAVLRSCCTAVLLYCGLAVLRSCCTAMRSLRIYWVGPCERSGPTRLTTFTSGHPLEPLLLIGSSAPDRPACVPPGSSSSPGSIPLAVTAWPSPPVLCSTHWCQPLVTWGNPCLDCSRMPDRRALRSRAVHYLPCHLTFVPSQHGEHYTHRHGNVYSRHDRFARTSDACVLERRGPASTRTIPTPYPWARPFCWAASRVTVRRR